MDNRHVLVLGGGINGAAVARELVLNNTPVWLVDTADLASGATAYSSRLIHGGLRYLEFAEFSLVRESLDERARLLRLAPHLVKPLRLFIPVRNRWGGLVQAAGKFLGVPLKSKTTHRGLRVVQLGLALYDYYARDPTLPRRSLHRPGDSGVPAVDPNVARRLWAYSDAQITFPERLVIDLLTDARQLAAERGLDFRVMTYHRAALHGNAVEISPVDNNAGSAATLQPAAIINATGAWVDTTLSKLPVPSPRLMGGTKGSHFLTYQPRLAELLQGQGVYTEARDGRPVFLLPFCGGTLVGTTDIPFEGDPATAVATEDELTYLLQVVADIFPGAALSRADIVMHQCGVRPLPYVDARTPAAITRRHQLVFSDAAPLPLVSLVGGKLTTCRSLAEETAAALLPRLGSRVTATSRDRPIPSSRHTPRGDNSLPLPLGEGWGEGSTQTPPTLTSELISSIIQSEWVTHLEDLVERRLMLHFSPQVTRETLIQLADACLQHGLLPASDSESAIERCMTRLRNHFGLRVTDVPPSTQY
jgi:glycerol-3-phosphate dehydrogenase